jgi:uncharacterized membrane protein
VSSIRKSIDIDASPGNVFNYATNVATQPDWMKFLEGIDITSGDGRSKGTTDRCVIKLGTRAQTVEELWSEFDPPRSFARKSTGGMEMDGRMTFEPKEGGTSVEWTIGYVPPAGTLGKVVDALFMNRVFQNEMEESLESLKAQLEG